MMQIRANLVISANGATTLRGSSRGLSSRGDRNRFHRIRQWAGAIVIGGATARNEPYAQTPLPLYIWSRAGELPEHLRTFAHAQIISGEISSVLAAIHADGIEELLCESGPMLLTVLLEEDLLDGIWITRSQIEGDGDFLDIDSLLQNYRLSEESSDGGDIFQYFIRA